MQQERRKTYRGPGRRCIVMPKLLVGELDDEEALIKRKKLADAPEVHNSINSMSKINIFH